jgi:hypothetical protein
MLILLESITSIRFDWIRTHRGLRPVIALQ